MKLSTKGRYAARAMLELALESGEGPVGLRIIAERQEISTRYLERIMSSLVAAGFVDSQRGQRGGFILTRPPQEILLSDVVQAVEGSLAPVSCVDNPDLCARSVECITHDIWDRMKTAILEVLESITLADMVRMHLEKSSRAMS